MDIFDTIASRIIKEQELIIGPLAWEEARSVDSLQIIDMLSGEVKIAVDANHAQVIDNLVARYVDLFGRAARESCREAVVALIADLQPTDVPRSLT